MKEEIQKARSRENRIKFICSLIAVWAVFQLHIPVQMSGNNLLYAIGELHTYDPALFSSNVFMGEGVLSPRAFVDGLIALLMHINGGNWAAAVMATVHAGAAVMAFAVVNLIFRLTRKNQIIYAALFAVLMLINGNELASFAIVELANVGMGCGTAFALLGISFVIGEDKKFRTAWICMTAAVLFHVHEGFYGFAVVFLYFLLDCFRKRSIPWKESWGLLLYAGVLLGIMIPNAITDTASLTDAEFVSIYAQFRHPHHLVPSSWEWKDIVVSLFLIAGFGVFRLLYLYQNKRQEKKGKEKRVWFLAEMGLFLSSWAGAILVAYVFTEQYPVALVSTMFISKYFKYVVFLSLVWMFQTFIELIKQGNGAAAFVLLHYAFFTHQLSPMHLVMWFIFVCGVIYVTNKVNWKKVCPGITILAAALFALLVFGNTYMNASLRLKGIMVFILAVWGAEELASKRRNILLRTVSIGLGGVLLFCSLYSNFWRINNGRICFQSEENIMIHTMGEDLYRLANDFNSKTQASDMFLADPDQGSVAGWFQIQSRRNCYVVHKVVPSSKKTMKEWYDRYMAVRGILGKEAREMKDMMEKAGIRFVLVEETYFEKLEESGLFEIFAVCEGDSYRVYQVKEEGRDGA